MAIQTAFNKAKSIGLVIAESVTPVLKESKFRETGVITPEEFVVAGDHLVLHCPTWSWSGGEITKRKPYLPPDKQFLLTKNVPCFKRCKQIMSEVLGGSDHMIKLTDDDDEGWVDTHHGISEEHATVAIMSMGNSEDKLSEKKPDASTVLTTETADPSDDDDDEVAVDIDEYNQQTLEDVDPATVTPKPSEPVSKPSGVTATTSAVLQTRRYDLNITYDKFYQTPRFWLFGYSENESALTEELMYEDISQDHLNKTVTMESHPHLPPPSRLSIHPCRHAEVMKRIMDTVAEGGGHLEVHMYLMVFLKFVQAVIPTIEYDFTREFKL